MANVQIHVDPSCEGLSAELAHDKCSKGKSPAQLLQMITEGWISAVRQHIQRIHQESACDLGTNAAPEISLTITRSMFVL